MPTQYRGFRASRPTARVCNQATQQYEVFFIVYDEQGRKHPIRYKRGINKLPLSQRKAEAIVKAEAMWEALRNGWNPLTKQEPFFTEEYERARQQTFQEALEYCLKVKSRTIARGSLYNYRSITKYLQAAAVKSGLDQSRIAVMERKDIRLIIETARELNDWTTGARNQALGILKALLSVLVEEDRIKHNPAAGIKKEREPESGGYTRITDEQKELIAEHLSQAAPAYFEFVMFVYQAGIRPKELLMLQAADISMVQREIVIRKEVSKTKKRRAVPMTDDLFAILLSRGVSDLPREWYIFSSNDFRAGPKAYWRTAGARWWRKYVIHALGIDCKLYSLKHKGADDKILADLPLDALRSLYGHGSTQMTQRYVSTLQQKYKEQIIASAPSFAKVVQMKKAK